MKLEFYEICNPKGFYKPIRSNAESFKIRIPGVSFISIPFVESQQTAAQCNRCAMYLTEDQILSHLEFCQRDVSAKVVDSISTHLDGRRWIREAIKNQNG